ncbi:hemolysin family protein [Angustibacter sp. McL0619]|uniref:hemolysin family protein n=1 Tax=Angustibacter sp. McL0619 TaxID=3415676 RepID=UPI003CEBECEB
MITPDARLALAVVLLVVFAAALAAAEASVSKVTRVRAEQLVEDGRRGSASLLAVVGNSGPFLSVSTFVRVVCESFAAVFVTITCAGAFERQWVALLVAAAIMVVASFVLVGVSPRTVGRQHAETVALLSAPVLLWLSRLLGPLARLLVALGNAVTPGRGYRDGPFSSESELRELLDLAGQNSVIEASEQQMLHSVFELGDTIVREVMVPRTDMVTIEHDKVLRQGLSLFLRSGFSRIPVVDEGPDDVLGMLYLKDVTRRVYLDAASEQSVRVRDVMRPVHYVPESKPVDDLMREMQRDQTHVAVVVDEYGGTAGLVTIEDVLEEIVGEIADEYDREADAVERLDDGTIRVQATLHVDELGELFDLELDDEDVDTVGGLLGKALGRVPIPGARAVVEGLELTAERPAGRRHRIATVIVRDVRGAAEADAKQADAARLGQ